MGLAGVHAGGEGVQAADAMGKPLFFKEVQRAIGDGGLIAEAFGGKAGQHVIGPHRPMRLKQYLKRAAAHGGQTQAARGDQSLGAGKGIMGAMCVVMLGKGEIGRSTSGAVIMEHLGHRRLLTCYSITYICHPDPQRKRHPMRYIISLPLAILPLPLMAEVPAVVTDIPPVHALVSQVMGDLGAPVLLLEKSADEHDFQLRPSQMQSIAYADVVIWVGRELTPWLDRALEGSAAASLPLLDASPVLRSYDEADHANESDADHDAHVHDGLDPHAWLDPKNAAAWLEVIAADLARLDPEHAAVYAGNAARAAAQVMALDGEISASLARAKPRPFITQHDAYGYFTAHFGLTYAGALSAGDAAAPGAAHVQELQAQVAGGRVVCLFPEAQHDPALLTQVQGGSTARMGGALDPVGSTIEAGPEAYATLLRGLAQTLADCLNGA